MGASHQKLFNDLPGVHNVSSEPPPWEYILSRDLFLYVSPVLIVFGTLGNFLSLLILQSPLYRKYPCSFLLSALVVVDIGVLNTGLMRIWIIMLTKSELEIRNLSRGGCKVHTYLSYLFPQLSSWTLTLMTFERAVAVILPMRAPQICSRKHIVIAWIVMVAVLVAMSSHILFTFDLRLQSHPDRNDTTRSCSYDFTDEDPSGKNTSVTSESTASIFYTKVWPIMDICIVSIIPLVCILPCNSIIIHKILRPEISYTAKFNLRNLRKRHGIRSATMMLILLSVFFFLTTSPIQIYFVGIYHWPLGSPEEQARTELAFAICTLIYNCNSAFNFILYCISGSKFRLAAVHVLCYCCKGYFGEKSKYFRSTYRTSGLTSTKRMTVAGVEHSMTSAGTQSSQLSTVSTDTLPSDPSDGDVSAQVTKSTEMLCGTADGFCTHF